MADRVDRLPDGPLPDVLTPDDEGPRVFNTVAELRGWVDRPVGVSRWHLITQDMVDTFAAITGDDQWIHTDPVRAADGPFGGTIAHGYLILSLISMLSAEAFVVKNSTMGINYGSNRVRFASPVRVGSLVRASVVLRSCEARPDGATKLTKLFTIVTDGGERPACVAEVVSLLRVVDDATPFTGPDRRSSHA